MVILEATVLTAIIALFFLISPNLMVQQVNAKPTSVETTDSLREINERYIELFHFSSATLVSTSSKTQNSRTDLYLVRDTGKLSLVTVDSSIIQNPDSKQGFSYNAEFKSGDKFNCQVHESILEMTNGNQITTDVNQTVRGTYNFSVISRENKIIGTTTTKQSDIRLDLTNESGSYFMNIKSDLTLEPDESAILQGTVTIDENLYEPRGHYIVELEKKPTISKMGIQLNATAEIKATVTLPDGEIIDPYYYEWNDLIFPWGLYGWAIAWYAWETITIGIVTTLLSAAIAATGPVGITIVIIALIFDVSAFFVNSYSMTCMYVEYVDCFYIPKYGEAGYYTDTIAGQYLGGWGFIPGSPENEGVHASIWPNNYPQW